MDETQQCFYCSRNSKDISKNESDQQGHLCMTCIETFRQFIESKQERNGDNWEMFDFIEEYNQEEYILHGNIEEGDDGESFDPNEETISCVSQGENLNSGDKKNNRKGTLQYSLKSDEMKEDVAQEKKSSLDSIHSETHNKGGAGKVLDDKYSNSDRNSNLSKYSKDANDKPKTIVNIPSVKNLNDSDKRTANTLNINQSQVSQVTNTPESVKNSKVSSSIEDQLCPQHKRRMEVVCQDCREILCAKCALFGGKTNHNGHQFTEIGEVVKDIAGRAKNIQDKYAVFEDEENKILKQKLNKEKEKLKKKKDEFIDLIDERFKELREFINDKRNDLVEELEKIYDNLREKVETKHTLPNKLKSNIVEWKKEAQEMMKIFTASKKQLAFELLYDKNKPESSDILYKSNKLMEDLKIAFGKMGDYSDKVLSSVSFNVEYEDIKEFIDKNVMLDWNFKELKLDEETSAKIEDIANDYCLNSGEKTSSPEFDRLSQDITFMKMKNSAKSNELENDLQTGFNESSDFGQNNFLRNTSEDKKKSMNLRDNVQQKIKDFAMGNENLNIMGNNSGSSFDSISKQNIQQVNVVNVNNKTRVYNQVNYQNQNTIDSEQLDNDNLVEQNNNTTPIRPKPMMNQFSKKNGMIAFPQKPIKKMPQMNNNNNIQESMVQQNFVNNSQQPPFHRASSNQVNPMNLSPFHGSNPNQNNNLGISPMQPSPQQNMSMFNSNTQRTSFGMMGMNENQFNLSPAPMSNNNNFGLMSANSNNSNFSNNKPGGINFSQQPNNMNDFNEDQFGTNQTNQFPLFTKQAFSEPQNNTFQLNSNNKQINANFNNPPSFKKNLPPTSSCQKPNDQLTISDDVSKMVSMDSYSTEEPVSEHGAVIQTEYGKKMLKKKLKIDISHSKAFGHQKSGSSEVVDFTGHEQGDAGMAFQYDFILENKKMTSLKQMKNKITNDGASVLFHALCRNRTLQSLNLNINMITEKCLDNQIIQVKNNKALKKIYLGQNNINQKVSKSKLYELKNLGVTVQLS